MKNGLVGAFMDRKENLKGSEQKKIITAEIDSILQQQKTKKGAGKK